MRSTVRALLLAGTVALGAGPAAVLPTAAAAQVSADISFDSFHDQLARHGDWLYSDRWGMVWQPGDVPDDFRPYDTDGHWVYTDDDGWLWVSDYAWGDIAFHYGRWVNDPDDGWLWIPGYTWSPGWVVWRTDSDYIGWMPMPPDEAFLEGAGISVGFGGGAISFNWGDPYYGYRRWYGGDYSDRRFARNWVFVGYGHMADPDYHRYVVNNPAQVVNIVHQTHTIVNYTVVNNYVVNKGVDVHMVERAAHHPIRAVAARAVIKHPEFVATIETGRRAHEKFRAIAPLGKGVANSAPPPSTQVVEKLSTRERRLSTGKPAAHLFTRADIGKPEVANRFHGKPAAGFMPGATSGAGNTGGKAGGGMNGNNGGEAGTKFDTLHGRHPGTESKGPGAGTGSATAGGSTVNGENAVRLHRNNQGGGSPPGSETTGGPTTGGTTASGGNKTLFHRNEHLQNGGNPPGGEPGGTNGTSTGPGSGAGFEVNHQGRHLEGTTMGGGAAGNGAGSGGSNTSAAGGGSNGDAGGGHNGHEHRREAKPSEGNPPSDNGEHHNKHKDDNNPDNGPH